MMIKNPFPSEGIFNLNHFIMFMLLSIIFIRGYIIKNNFVLMNC